ncbi:TonB-dependent receptor [Thalassotalea sp. PLHSN55]|uniref:TonB-dependent receptor n=1 Tax=Thalassotalea sp. PLHSN55 TaxID=3435888 RepID=UPI003F82D93D
MKTLGKSIDSRFKISKVALATSAVLIGSLTVSQAYAEEQAAEKIEVIEVTGIRSSIIAGLDLKRNSENIVDAVSSEDIGKFPDANLAESLQRIPEVSIDRDGGEGRYVTIRGLGPEFNQVLLNGRKLASSEATRAFSFDTIASDLVSEMLVYKTQNASLTEGGLGGTIDVRTARPLDQDGLVISGTLKSLYEDQADTYNPQGSFLISNTFLDGKVGALFSATYQSRENRTYTVDNSGIVTGGIFLEASPNAYGGNYYSYSNLEYTPAYSPVELNRSVVEEDRNRLGLSGVLQFRPNDQLDITVDYLYSKFQADKTIHTKSNWLSGIDAPGEDILGWYGDFIAASQTEVDANGVVTQMSRNSWTTSTAFNREDEYRDTETQMFGINVDYMINEDTKLVVDAAWSNAIDDNQGRNTRRSMLVRGVNGYVVNTNADVPYIVNGGNSHIAGTEGIEGDMVFGRNWDSGNDIEAENFQVSADLTFSHIEDWTIRTGVIFESSKKSNAEYDTPEDLQRLYQRSSSRNRRGMPFPEGVLDLVTDGILTVDSADLGQPSSDNNDMYIINVDAFTDFISNPNTALDNLTGNDAIGTNATNTRRYDAMIANGGFGAALTGNSFEVEEEVTSFYLEGAYSFMLGDMEGEFIGGLRYTHTDLTTLGYSRILTDLSPTTCDGENVPAERVCYEPEYADPNGPDGLTRTSLKSSYDDVLPSITMNLNLTDDIILRLATSQSMTRPYLEDLAPKFDVVGQPTDISRVAKSNNEDLTPYKSTNLDASLEWYFAEGSMASVAAYHKTIEDYVAKESVPNVVIDTVETEEFQEFTVTRPSNAQDIKVSGISFNLQQTFDMGLGYQFNYTWVDTDTDFDPDTFDDTQVALPGLGDTLNLVGFYEQGPFAARIAYNYRKEFLSDAQYLSGLAWGDEFNEPVFTDDYDQVDARVSYEIMDNIVVFVEGVNLTESTLSQHGRYDNIFVSYEDFGKRYVLGLSGKF